MRRALFTVLAIALTIVLATAPLAAQANTSAADDIDLCLGFAFGTWKPALDWVAAGHTPGVDTTVYPKAAGGRDWAIPGAKSEGDTTFVLFPMWWPAGVVVSLEHFPKGTGDTVRGRAAALVADVRKPVPTTLIRAWQKSCRG